LWDLEAALLISLRSWVFRQFPSASETSWVKIVIQDSLLIAVGNERTFMQDQELIEPSNREQFIAAMPERINQKRREE
jgi:hypothetical protein